MAQVVRTEPRVHLEIAGDGVLRADLEKLTAELGIAGNVRFLGEVADIPALLSRASLFVLPSHSEGISLTLLEAMARGLPVVTTSVGGNTEVVIDGETGFLVPADDPAALALENPPAGRRLRPLPDDGPGRPASRRGPLRHPPRAGPV